MKTLFLSSSAMVVVCAAALLSDATASPQRESSRTTVRTVDVRPLASEEVRRVTSAAEAATALPAVAPASMPAVPTRPHVRVHAADAVGLSADVLSLALRAVTCGIASGDLGDPHTLTVIDYSRPSTESRLWVFDLRTGERLFTEHVAHGVRTGDNMATQFSDVLESRQSSIGLFRTDETYVGRNGYSLRLDGLEPGFNAHARERAIVVHGAPYVDAAVAAQQGRLGRSWGCPAVRDAVARDLIDTIAGGGVIFSYYPDAEWLRTSRFLTCPAGEDRPDGPLPGERLASVDVAQKR